MFSFFSVQAASFVCFQKQWWLLLPRQLRLLQTECSGSLNHCFSLQSWASCHFSLGLQSLSTYTPVLPCHADDSRKGWQTLLGTSLAQALSLMRHSQAKYLHHASEPARSKRVYFQSPIPGSEPESMLDFPLLTQPPCPALVHAPSWQYSAGRGRREPSLRWEAQEVKASSKVPHSKGGPVCSLEFRGH